MDTNKGHNSVNVYGIQDTEGMTLRERTNDDRNLRQQKNRKLRGQPAEKFMENFNPDTSVRETRKMNRKIYIPQSKRNTIYDNSGVHITSGKDLCDCLDETCPGCHYPCQRCTSQKCGQECRVSRRWIYEQYEIDGTDIIVKNPLKK